jgi:hypothetical protein
MKVDRPDREVFVHLTFPKLLILSVLFEVMKKLKNQVVNTKRNSIHVSLTDTWYIENQETQSRFIKLFKGI